MAIPNRTVMENEALDEKRKRDEAAKRQQNVRTKAPRDAGQDALLPGKSANEPAIVGLLRAEYPRGWQRRQIGEEIRLS